MIKPNEYYAALRASLTAVLIVSLFLCGCTCSRGEKTASEERGKEVEVKVMAMKYDDCAGTKAYVGVARASKSTILSCPHSGTLILLRAKQGECVRKGDTLAIINSPVVRASKDMAYATLEQARDGYERVVKVHESGSVADVKMMEVQAQLNKAEAAAKAADHALDECTIRAPYSGTIGEVYVTEGIEISAAAPISEILDISDIEIEFSVPENEVGELALGDAAFVEVPALGESGKFGAAIKAKGVSASSLSHSYNCTLRPDANVRGLMPGMVCKISMESRIEKKFIVPASIIKTDASGRYVWGVRGGKAVKIRVVPQGYSGKGVIVSGEIAEDDAVITEGTRNVSTGMNVKVIR